jgi:glutamyl-tRNA reductase
MFWLTTNHALFVSTFIWLGRIFDHKSAHNIDLLLKAVEQNLPELGRDALRKLKEVITSQQAADYVKDRHDTVIDDVRELRKQVKAWREVRYHLAHNKQGVATKDSSEPLLQFWYRRIVARLQNDATERFRLKSLW